MNTNKMSLFSLPVHHLGIAMNINNFTNFTSEKSVNFDETQGVHTCFEFNNHFNCYVEYFTISGRALNYTPGFHHICYEVTNLENFVELKKYILLNRLGFQITQIEKSGSKECNNVVFFYLKKFGVIEFNIND